MVEKTPAGRMTELSLLSGKEIDYKLICTEGVVHLPTFTMQGIFNGLSAKGKASSKKAAKQRVANELLKLLQNQPPGDQLPGLEKVLEGWNYDDILSSEGKNPTAHSNVFNAVGALHEFQAKTKAVQVVFEDLKPQEDEDGKTIFRTQCILNGHIDEKTGKPLVGTGSALQKQESKRKAAEVVAQVLVDQGLLDAKTLKVIDDPKKLKEPEVRDPEVRDQGLLIDINDKFDPRDFLVSNASDDQGWTTAVADDQGWTTTVVDDQGWTTTVVDDWSVREDHEVPQPSHPENYSTDSTQYEMRLEGAGSGMNGSVSEDDLIVKEVKGSFERLCVKLEGIGKKAVVNTLTKQADEGGENVHSIILVIEPEKSSSIDSVNHSVNPSWVGRGLDIHTAKDVAAYKGLRHFSWLSEDANKEIGSKVSIRPSD